MTFEQMFGGICAIAIFVIGIFVKRNDKRLDKVDDRVDGVQAQQQIVAQALGDFKVEVEKSKTEIAKELGEFKLRIVEAIHEAKK